MSTEAYINKKFSADSMDIIEFANELIELYQAQGYTLTLRQLYYQFIAADKFPNTEQSYKRLGTIIGDARLSGLIDWDAIEDRARTFRQFNFFSNPRSFLERASNWYHTDWWKEQNSYCEVWVEKDALSGIVEQVADQFHVGTLACRGYLSLSAMHEAAERFIDRMNEFDCRSLSVIYLGDHDPSGLDMPRDIQERFDNFGAGFVNVEHIALNLNQIREFNPPPNPLKIKDGKLSDSRGRSYQSQFGDSSWELDALKPEYLSQLIERAIINHIYDSEKFEQAKSKQTTERKKIRNAKL